VIACEKEKNQEATCKKAPEAAGEKDAEEQEKDSWVMGIAVS
jgi:hypothetical protein